MMDFDTMIDHIEQLRAENEAEDALDEKRLRELVEEYGEEEGREMFYDLYGSHPQATINLSVEEQEKYREQGMDGVDMIHLFGSLPGA